jgi:hypothetical protein
VTLTTTSTTLPSSASGDGELSPGYEVYLADMGCIRDREIGAQVLANPTGEATALAAEALERQDHDGYLGWQETASLFDLLSCVMRGYVPDYPEHEDNWGWARDEWKDVAVASSPAEFAAAYDAARKILAALAAAPATEGEQQRHWDDGGIHPAAMARLDQAVAAICSAPWGLLPAAAASHRNRA